jgi:hypothetical protein
MDIAMGVAMERVTHEPETYAHYREGLICWLERILQGAGISQDGIKLST